MAVIEYQRIPIKGDAIVVSFDLCSSSNIYEQLLLRGPGEVQRLTDFLTSVKEFLAGHQLGMPEGQRFDPYKFMGDGWLLLFPPVIEQLQLTTFLMELCFFVRKGLKAQILPFLETRPKITGVTFGIERGPLAGMRIFGVQEYHGRAINVACRLQGAFKDGGSGAYRALVSAPVYHQYFEGNWVMPSAKTSRKLRNIRDGADFECWEIDVIRHTESLHS